VCMASACHTCDCVALGAMMPMTPPTITAALNYLTTLMRWRAAFLSGQQPCNNLDRENPLCPPTRSAAFSEHTCS